MTGAALWLTPRGHRVAATGRLALTTAVRVVNRVHRDAAAGGPLALPANPPPLHPHDVDGPFAQRHNRPLVVLALAKTELGAPGLALAGDRVDRRHLHPEHLLHGDLDLGLVGPGGHHERVLALVEQGVTLLGDHRRDQDVARVLVQDGHLVSSASRAAASVEVATALTPRPLGRARNASSAALVNTTSSDSRTSYVLSWSAISTCTRSTLRSDFAEASSSRSSTTSTWRRSVRVSRIARAALVEGSASTSRKDDTTCTRPARARSERAPRSAAAFIFLGVRWL